MQHLFFANCDPLSSPTERNKLVSTILSLCFTSLLRAKRLVHPGPLARCDAAGPRILASGRPAAWAHQLGLGQPGAEDARNDAVVVTQAVVRSVRERYGPLLSVRILVDPPAGQPRRPEDLGRVGAMRPLSSLFAHERESLYNLRDRAEERDLIQ